MTSIPLLSPGAYNTIGGISNFTEWQHKTLQQQLHETELHKHSLNQRLVELEAQNRAYEGQVRELAHRDQEQHKVILQIQSDKEELVRWIEGKQKEYDAILQQAHVQIDQMKNDNIRLQQDNQRLAHEYQLLEQRFRQSEDEHTKVIAQLKYQNEQAIQKIQMADNHIGELNIKHQDNHRFITTLHTTKEEMERWIDNKQREHETQVRLMQQQLEQMRMALEQCQKEVLQEREHFSQFEIQTNQRIQQQLAKEQDLNLQLMTARQELNRQMVKDKDQHQALISLSANKDDQNRWIEAKSREYENKLIQLRSQLELANTTIQQLQHELDVQVGRYQKFELDASNLINALQQKDKDNIHLIGEIQTQLSILRTSEGELLKSNKKLQQERSEIFTQMEVRTREYEARIVSLTSEAEKLRSSSDAYQKELDLILQRYQILDRDSSSTIIKLQSTEKEHLNQISTLNALVMKLQAETNRLDVVMTQKVTELHREKDKKDGMNAVNENKVNELAIEIDNYRRLLEERSAIINENEVKLSDWQKRYWTLVDQSRDEILKMGNQFRKDCDEAETRYTIRLKQLEQGSSQEKQQLISEYERKLQTLMMIERECEEERNSLRMAVTQLQEEKRNLEAQLRELRVIGQAKDQEKTGEIFSLQTTKEEILRQFQITKSEYENKFMSLSSQVEHLKANLDSTTKELQIQINKFQSLENESSIQIAALTQKESDLLFQVQTLDATANRLQLENQRLDSISKQMVIELQILCDKKEDLRIIDEFQLNEKDLELGRLRRTEVEQRTKIEVLEKQIVNLQSDTTREINRLKNQITIQKKDLETLITKMNQLDETHKVTDKHLTVLAVDHENEINLWRARYYDKEAENGRLQSQLRLLISEVDVAWVRIGEFEQDKSGKLQKELDNMRAQFDMLSKHYEKMARERGMIDLRNSKSTVNRELIVIKEEYEATIQSLKQELITIKSQYSSLEEKNREMSKQISIEQNRYQEELRIRLDTLREENVRLKSDAESYLKQLESKITLISQLQIQYDEVSQRYESISTKYNLIQTQLEQDRVKAQREQDLLLQSHTHITQTQITEIKSQVLSLSDQNNRLHEKIRLLQQDNAELEAQLRLRDEHEIRNEQLFTTRQSELQKQIYTLEQRIQTMEKERERTTTELHLLQRESVTISNQQTIIQELRATMTRQQQEIQSFQDRVNKLTIEKSEMSERISFLQQEKNMQRHSTQSLELQYADVYNKTSELQGEIQSKQKEIDSLKLQLIQVQNEKSTLISQQTQIRHQASSHELELKKLIQINSRLESENVTLNSILKVTEQERDQYITKFEENRGSSTQVTQDLHKQIRQLTLDLQTEQRSKQEFQRTMQQQSEMEQKFKFENEELRARQEGFTKEVRMLKEQLSSFQVAKDEVLEKDRKIIQLKSDLELERKRYQQEFEAFRIQQLTATASTNDLNRLKYEQEQFRLKEANLEETMKKQKQEFERKTADMEQKFNLQRQTLQANHNLEIEQYKQQIQSVEQRLQNKDGEIMGLLEQIQGLQRQNRDRQNQVLEMSSQLDKVKQDHQKVTSQLVFFEEERNSLTNKLGRVSSEIKDLTHDDELKKAKQQYQALQNDLNRMQEQKDQEIYQLSNELKALKNGDNKVSQLLKQNQQLQQQLDRLKSDSQTEQYLNKIADLENDIEVLIEDGRNQLKKNQDLQDMNNVLQQELSRSRNRSPQPIIPNNNGSNTVSTEVYDKLVGEIKVLNQKLHKYERVIGDLEQALTDSHRKEDDLIRQISDLKNRSSSPEKSDLPLKVIQLEQELVQARNQIYDYEQRLLKQDNLSELQEKDEEIEVLIEQIKKNDVEIRELRKENQNLKAQLQDYQKEVSFMKDILNDSNHKSRSEPQPQEVERLKSYVIELENKCALYALENALAKKNQQRGSRDAMPLQREMEDWKTKATQLQRELDAMNTPDVRYWQADYSQNFTMSTRNQLGNLGFSNINP